MCTRGIAGRHPTGLRKTSSYTFPFLQASSSTFFKTTQSPRTSSFGNDPRYCHENRYAKANTYPYADPPPLFRLAVLLLQVLNLPLRPIWQDHELARRHKALVRPCLADANSVIYGLCAEYDFLLGEVGGLACRKVVEDVPGAEGKGLICRDICKNKSA